MEWTEKKSAVLPNPPTTYPAAQSAWPEDQHPAAGQHSTLEVLPQGNDLIVVPADHDKYTVQNVHGVFPYDHVKETWRSGRYDEARILGLRRRTFLIIAWILSVLVALGAGIGGSLGATSRSRNTCTATSNQGDSILATSDDIAPNTIPATSISSINPSTTSIALTSTAPSPQTQTSTIPKPTTTTTNLGPSAGGGGGRCANEWGGDCICLDRGICSNRWKGVPYTGTVDNRPCPDDPDDDVMACIVQPCLGRSEPSQCLWREACRNVTSSSSLVADAADKGSVCPGDGDFVCCGHSW